jgi:LemA protein
MNPLFAIVIVGVVLVGWVIVSYNGFIRLRKRLEEATSDIDVQLKRRYDLIPNLMETVKGYAAHEKQLFENVTAARTRAMGATGMAEKEQAENALSGTLKTLFAVAENYPQLRASENFQQLHQELVDTEDKIQAARRFYNSVGRDPNIKVETVPSNVIARLFSFSIVELFKAGEEEKKNVQVKF